MHVGHLEAGLRSIQKTLSLNPANSEARFRIAAVLMSQQKYEEAIAQLNRVPQQVIPANWTYYMAWALLSLGRTQEAARHLEVSLREHVKDPGGLLHGARGLMRAKSGDRRGAEADIVEAIRSGKGFYHFHHTAYSIGAIYCVLGDLEKAQQWIENAAADGFPCYALFESDPHLAPLRATARFQSFLAKLRLEWEHISGEPE